MPKLLDRVRALMRLRHYSYETEKRYIYWIRHYTGFHNIRFAATDFPVSVDFVRIIKRGFGSKNSTLVLEKFKV